MTAVFISSSLLLFNVHVIVLKFTRYVLGTLGSDFFKLLVCCLIINKLIILIFYTSDFRVFNETYEIINKIC